MSAMFNTNHYRSYLNQIPSLPSISFSTNNSRSTSKRSNIYQQIKNVFNKFEPNNSYVKFENVDNNKYKV